MFQCTQACNFDVSSKNQMQAPSVSQLTFTDCETGMIIHAFINQVTAEVSDGTQATEKCFDRNVVHLNQSGLNDSVANLKRRKKHHQTNLLVKSKNAICTECSHFMHKL